MGRFFFFIREGLRALRRSAAPSLAAIVTVCLTVLTLGVLIPVIQTANGKTNEVRDQVGLRIFLSDVDAAGQPLPAGTVGQQAPQDQVDALRARLTAIPHVQSVQFVSKDQAKEILSQRLKDENRDDITAQLPGTRNPLPASFNVAPDDLANLSGIRAAITPPGANGKPAPISPLISDIGDSRDDASKINGATTAIRWVLAVVAGMLLIASLLLVGNTIRLSIYARRREVEVMRLVGATNWFIRWPFMVEGLVCGLVGGAIAIGLLFLGKQVIVDPLANNFNLIDSGDTIPFASLALVLLGVAMGVSAMGSGLTLRRFLRI
ncbi:MAG TPA: permease-like cell division protein FtsX [Solirubrobacterales bacterium]|nr:permease-like cell division protein FtsX [Solirubrobacterales bacterium]